MNICEIRKIHFYYDEFADVSVSVREVNPIICTNSEIHMPFLMPLSCFIDLQYEYKQSVNIYLPSPIRILEFCVYALVVSSTFLLLAISS